MRQFICSRLLRVAYAQQRERNPLVLWSMYPVRYAAILLYDALSHK